MPVPSPSVTARHRTLRTVQLRTPFGRTVDIDDDGRTLLTAEEADLYRARDAWEVEDDEDAPGAVPSAAAAEEPRGDTSGGAGGNSADSADADADADAGLAAGPDQKPKRGRRRRKQG